MKHLLVVFSILVLLLFPFQPLKVQAETGISEDYLQYDSFQKRYFEHASELMYLASVSYDSNEHYFKENMSLYKDAVMEVFNANEGGFIDTYFESATDLFSKPLAFLLSANDVRRELFDKIKGFFFKEEPGVAGVTVGGNTIVSPAGYLFYVTNDNGYGEKGTNITIGLSDNALTAALYGAGSYKTVFNDSDLSVVEPSLYQHYAQGELSLVDYQYLFDKHGFDIYLVVEGQEQNRVPLYTQSVPVPIQNVINNIINGGQSSNAPALQNYEPTVQPVLVCPDDTVNLQYDTGTFKTVGGDVVTISEGETSTYLGELCNLDFKFPEVYYHEDSNKLIVDGQDLSPSLPTEGFDNGIIAYIQNSYNYATTVVNSGVNGLKSIIAGTAGLVTFSGSLFGFLPPEILTLFIGGFSVALGLWVFKK